MAISASVRLHRFPESVLAEVIEESAEGEISIRSHELIYDSREQDVLHPRDELSSSDAMLIRECAAADGFVLADNQRVKTS